MLIYYRMIYISIINLNIKPELPYVHHVLSTRREHILSVSIISQHHLNLAVDAFIINTIRLNIAGVVTDTVACLHCLLHEGMATARTMTNLGMIAMAAMALVRLADVK